LCAYYFALWGVFKLKEYPWLKIAIPSALALTLLLSAAGHLKKTNETEVIFFALKEGGAVFVESGGRERWLIDGGGSYSDTYDPGERVIAPFLAGRGIRRLDKIVITHPHYSSYAGLKYIVENFSVGEVITCPEISGERGYVELLGLIKSKDIPWREAWAGESFACRGSTISVLSPSTLSMNSDDNCLVLSVQSRGGNVVLAADAGFDAQERMAQESNLKCDVLALGSGGKVSERFIKKADPEYCIMSADAGGSATVRLPRRKGVFSTGNGAVNVLVKRDEVRVRSY